MLLVFGCRDYMWLWNVCEFREGNVFFKLSVMVNKLLNFEKESFVFVCIRY